VAGYYEHGNEPSGSIKGSKLLELLCPLYLVIDFNNKEGFGQGD
jgi:hypothetical protein